MTKVKRIVLASIGFTLWTVLVTIFAMTPCTEEIVETIIETVIVIVTIEPEIVIEVVEETVEVEVTRVVEVPVTITPTKTPEYTSTITLIPTRTQVPTRTQIPTATLSPLKKPKSDGFYLVGVDIAPGVWRSTPGHDGCYWETSTKTGSIINNHFGMSGGTCYIPSSAYMVMFADCGQWEYLGQ